MKQLIIGTILGLLLHKAVNFYYDYSWNQAFDSAECSKIFPLTARFTCTYKVMGPREMTKYILYRPAAPNDRQEVWAY